MPRTREIVSLTFNPQAGHEQAGRRPALALNPRSYNLKLGLALFCPTTSRAKGDPAEVTLPAAGAATVAVLADQIQSLDWRVRRVRFESNAPPRVVSILPGNRGSGDRTENSNVLSGGL